MHPQDFLSPRISTWFWSLRAWMVSASICSLIRSRVASIYFWLAFLLLSYFLMTSPSILPNNYQNIHSYENLHPLPGHLL